MTTYADTATENETLVDGRRLVTFYTGPEAPSNEYLGVQKVSISRAREFRMDAPAVTKTVYISHPHDCRHLIPFADFDGALANDKLNEGLRIVTALGASKIVAKAMRGYMSKDKFYAGIAPFNIDITNQNQVIWEVAFESEGTGHRPCDPGTIAYPEEPGFEAARTMVLHNGASRVRLEIQSHSSFNMGGELAGRLKDVGLRLGATSEKYRCTYFLLEAEFPQDSRAAA